MINQQLVDYIKQQLQAGVAKDVVRKALVDAGWPAADIDDSVKAGEPAAAAASPASQATINPVVAMGGVDAVAKQPSSTAATGNKFFSQSVAVQSKHDDDDHPSAKKFVVTMVVMGVVILLLAGALAFVYFTMSAQLSAQPPASGDAGQLATLQGQVQQLTNNNAGLTTQLSALTATTAELTNELGFFATPVTTTASSSSTSTPAAAPVTATVSGMLTGAGVASPFVLTTAHNVRIYVANYKDAKVKAALTPLSESTTTVQLSGTHVAASPNLTVTAVNGVAL